MGHGRQSRHSLKGRGVEWEGKISLIQLMVQGGPQNGLPSFDQLHTSLYCGLLWNFRCVWSEVILSSKYEPLFIGGVSVCVR